MHYVFKSSTVEQKNSTLTQQDIALILTLGPMEEEVKMTTANHKITVVENYMAEGGHFDTPTPGFLALIYYNNV